MIFKPRPNYSNTSTQHIGTLLAQHLQTPAKRSQHLKATDRNIAGRNMLHAFGHPQLRRVATCWKLEIELVRMPRRNIVARTWPNDSNIMQHPQMLHEKFDHFQIWAKNLTQHVATCCNKSQPSDQTHATCCTQQCCDRLCEMLRSSGGGFTSIGNQRVGGENYM